MVKKKQNKISPGIIILIITLVGAVIFFGISQTQFGFEEGWEPYGESTTSITGYNSSSSSQILDGKYWKFDRGKASAFIFRGNDFEIEMQSGTYRGGKYNSRNGIITSQESFSDKDFKATISIVVKEYGKANFEIPDFGYKQGLDVNLGSKSKEFNIHIKNSPVSNKVTLEVNGKDVKTIEKEDYKVYLKIFSNGNYGSTAIVTLSQPAWREQFGCTKEPDEQYFVKVFKEGDEIDKKDFPYWNKFCLNQPVKIYTPEGSTTTKEPMLGMIEEDKSYLIPPGQIWTVEYIGELQNPETACEKGEVYNLEEEKCMARTKIDFFIKSEDTTEDTTDELIEDTTEDTTEEPIEDTTEEDKTLWDNIKNFFNKIIDKLRW